VDWSRGRLYVPAEVWTAAGADPDDLTRGRITPAWRSALTESARVTHAAFEAGRSVCDVLRGRLRYELRATWLGGVRILDRLEQVGFDVFRRRPRLGAADALVIAWKALSWRVDQSD
jgi:phytoene/squalene synthetase